MCTAIFALDVHPSLIFLLAFNRDEFLDREAEPAHFWEEAPSVLAGRDKQSGGTWLGISKDGRVAFLTNFREGVEPKLHAKSRGHLVTDFLRSPKSPLEFLQGLDCGTYSDFSLVAANLVTGETAYINSADCRPVNLQPGIHGLSNGYMDAGEWRKVADAKEQLREILRRENPEGVSAPEILENILSNTVKTEDPSALPRTHYEPSVEKNLSSVFIDEFILKGKRYGTRSQTVLLARSDGEVTFLERFKGANGAWSQDTKQFSIPFLRDAGQCNPRAFGYREATP